MARPPSPRIPATKRDSCLTRALIASMSAVKPASEISLLGVYTRRFAGRGQSAECRGIRQREEGGGGRGRGGGGGGTALGYAPNALCLSVATGAAWRGGRLLR